MAPNPLVAEMLRCPECGQKPELDEATPRCPHCGYVGGQPVSGAPAPVTLYDPVFALAWEITRGHNTGRAFMHCCLRQFFDTRGVVLDLGSGKKPSYLSRLRVQPEVYLRGDGLPEFNPDLVVNFEQPLPLADGVVDGVLLMNVLEHIYDHKLLLREIYRVLKPGGKLYLYVPYLVRVHNSPYDYFRYTGRALHQLAAEVGFTATEVYANGGFIKFVPELYKKLGKIGIGYLLYPLTLALCLLDTLGGLVSRGRMQTDLACGFFMVAHKPEAGGA